MIVDEEKEKKGNMVMLRTKQAVYLSDYVNGSEDMQDESNRLSTWSEYSFFIEEGRFIVVAC